MPARTGVAVMLWLSACESSGGALGPTVELLDPEGLNAAAGVVEGVLRVSVAQNGRLIDCDHQRCQSKIENESFELTLNVRSLEASTTIQVFIDDAPDGALAGASPPFTPAGEGLESLPLRIVMSPLSAPTCRPLSLPAVRSDGRPRLVRPRRDLGVAVRRNLAILFGGMEADGAPSIRVGRFDQAVMETIPALTPTEQPAGVARGLALSEDYSVFVADGGFFRFTRNDTGEGMEPILREQLAVHPRASGASGLVDYGDGAAIVGGNDTRTVTWLDPTGTPKEERSALLAPRSDPAVVALAGGVLVVGGAAEGEPVAEWLEPGRDGALLEGLETLPPGRGGWLASSPSGEAILWIGAETMAGAPRAETYLIRGCPDACEVEAGPTWMRPRTEWTGVVTAAGDLWLVGGRTDAPTDAVDIVRWSDGPRIEAGPSLHTPRAGAVAFEHASGLVTVAGGEGPEGLLDDFEHCTPARLDPL